MGRLGEHHAKELLGFAERQVDKRANDECLELRAGRVHRCVPASDWDLE